MSASAVRRLRAEVLANAAPEPIPDDLEEWLRHYRPRSIEESTWAVIRPHLLEILVASGQRKLEVCKRRVSVLAAYLAWRHETGGGVALVDAMTFAAIDAYYRSGCSNLTEASRNTVRARLRKLAQHVNPSATSTPKGPTYGYQPVKPPYSLVEEATIRRAVLRYRNQVTRRKLCLIVGLCGGAGLDASDLSVLSGECLHDLGEDGIRVVVPGRKPRTVWVRRSYEEVVREALTGIQSTKTPLVGTKPSGRNSVGAVIERATFYGNVPRLEAARLRSTWIVWALTQNIPLPLVMKAAGLNTARSLAALAEYVTVDLSGESFR